ncbi:MAG: hypothetical protein O7B35_01430 [Deltaproteobacteria bacterium]|nr:hypothetical protein [Deltaproteobacteria bacterium]
MAGKRKAEAKRWFQQASFDLRAVRWNTKGGTIRPVFWLSKQVRRH